jgi:hypothetical protein
MNFGTAFHSALDIWWQTADTKKAVALLYKELQNPGQQIIAEVLLLAYAKRYGNDGYTFLEAESEKWVRNYRDIADLCGVWDKFAKDNQGRHCVVEHKTTRTNIKPESNYWIRREVADLQVDMYWLMAAELGLDVEYILYDVIQVPKLRRERVTPVAQREYYKRNGKYGKKGQLKRGMRETEETWPEFRVRVIEHVKKNHKEMFVRKKFYRSRADTKRTEADIVGVANQILTEQATWEDGEMSPRNIGSCYDFNSQCEFHPVCHGETTLDNKELYEKKEER